MNKNISLSKEDYQSQLKKIYEERNRIQNRIKKLEAEEKLNDTNKERKAFEQKAHNNYIRDNFHFMNILMEEYFKKNLIRNNEDELKKFVKKDFDKFQNQLMEDFTLFKNKQKV